MNGKLNSDRSFQLLTSRLLAVAGMAVTVLATSLMTVAISAPALAETKLSDAFAGKDGGMETSSIVDGITNANGRGDRLAVTVARVAGHEDAADATRNMDIWVGEVSLKGRKAVWVELIDDYGEVVYDAEVKKNETHLLPDGRAIVVRALPDGTQIAKVDSRRVASDANLVVTRRVVDENDTPTSVEFFEEKTQDNTHHENADTALVALARFGERVWEAVTAFVSGTADNIRYAFRWVMDVVAA